MHRAGIAELIEFALCSCELSRCKSLNLALLSAIMPPHSAAQFADLHDADFAYEILGLARFRVNVFLQRGAVGTVIRMLPHLIPTMESLGVPLLTPVFRVLP
mgnify:CR=1 FL=1